MTTLKPSEVKSHPDRYPPDRIVTLRFPLGEAEALALPLVLLGLKDDLHTGPIKTSDRWAAQGLEGAGEIKTTWAKAWVLSAKLTDGRGAVLVSERV